MCTHTHTCVYIWMDKSHRSLVHYVMFYKFIQSVSLPIYINSLFIDLYLHIHTCQVSIVLFVHTCLILIKICTTIKNANSYHVQYAYAIFCSLHVCSIAITILVLLYFTFTTITRIFDNLYVFLAIDDSITG